MADIMVAVTTAALVLVTGALVVVTWRYARSTKQIADASARAAAAAVETAQSSERSAQTGVKAAEAAARSAEAAEVALLAEAMPFVRPSFDDESIGRIKTDMRTVYTVFVKNSGRHAALNVELLLGEDLLHTFPVVEPDSSEQYKLSNNAMMKRFWEGPGISHGWLLRTRYFDPYGNRYEVVEEHVAPGGVTPEHRVSTYRFRDGRREPLLGGEGWSDRSSLSPDQPADSGDDQ